MKMTQRVLALIMVMATLFSSFAFATELPEAEIVIAEAIEHEHDENCEHEEADGEEYVLAALADEVIAEEIGEIDLLDPAVYGDEILPEIAEKGGDFSNEWGIECTDCGENVEVDCINGYYDGHAAVCIHGVEGIVLTHSNDDGVMYDNGSSHYGRCDVCDKSMLWGTHYTPCNAEDTSVCAGCGYTVQDIEVQHEQAIMEYTYDSDAHWIPCANCDEKLYYGKHEASCDEIPESGIGYCTGCAKDGVNLTAYHSYSEEYKEVEGGHQVICANCAEPFGDIEDHYAECSAKNICAGCGYDNGDNFESWVHVGVESEYRYDTEYHYLWCNGCNDVWDSKVAHEANCQSKTECEYCDYVSTTGDIQKISHNSWDSDIYVSAGAEGHGYKCYDCGGAAGYGLDEHRGLCTDPTICRDCNYVSETPLTPAHLYENIDWDKYAPTEDGSGHGWLCTECNGAAVFGDEPEAHWQASCDDPYTCIDCGYTGTEELEYDHDPDYDTGYQPVEGGHAVLCTVCKEAVDEVEKHYGSCDDPYTCVECGFVSETAMNTEHEWNYWEYQKNDKGHWYACSLCGAAGETYEHWADCDQDTNVCGSCGYEGGEIRIDHIFWSENPVFQPTEYGHVRVCSVEGCGALNDNEEDHYVVCGGDAGKCSACNAEVKNALIEHDYDYDIYYSDKYRHWHKCSVCGVESYAEDHWAPCNADDKTTCYQCGEENIVAEADHDYDWDPDAMQWDETGHWAVCEDCGKADGKENHRALCSNPNKCQDCGYVNEDGVGRISHEAGARKSDAAYHWYVCGDCGQEVYKSEHYASCRNPKVCWECGYESDTDFWYSHEMSSTPVASDEYGHTFKCKYCDVTRTYLHDVRCDSESKVCSECGYECEYAYREHSWGSYIPTADGTACYAQCRRCDKILYYEEHSATCANPGVCESCGTKIDVEPEYVYHEYGEVYKSDDTYHYSKCVNCDKVSKSKHYDGCVNSDGKCDTCGKKTSNLSHNETYFKITADTHTAVCYDCGYEFKAYEHYGYCYNSEICMACGVPNPSKIYHVSGSTEEDCFGCSYIPPVEGATVSLNKTELTLGVKEKFTLTAEASHDATVTYKSNNTKVATVDAKTGKVTAKKVGTAVITAKTSTGVSAKCEVTVMKAPTSVKASVSKVTLGVGETFAITGKLSSKSASALTFSSAKKSVADIDENGVITANKVGTAKVYVKTFNGKKGLCTVTVKPAPEVVTVTSSKVDMSVGQTAKLTTKLTTAAGKTAAGSYTYTAEPAECVTIENGVLTANETGTVTVTATTYKNLASGSVTVNVLPAPDKAKVNVEGLALTLGVKETFTIKAEAENGSPADFTYSTDKKSVATVSKTGKITAKKTGTAVITVQPHQGESVDITVTVVSAPKSVKLSSKKLTLGVGEEATLKATLNSSKSASALKWKSSKTSVVEVDGEGNLIAKKAGKATITVTTFNKKKATCTVTVKAAPEMVNVTSSKTVMSVGQTAKLTTKLTTAAGKTAAGSYTYSAVPADCVTIDKGVLTAVNPGTVTVTATTYKNLASGSVTIEVKEAPDAVVIGKELSLGVKETFTLKPAVANGSPADFTYSTDKKAIATVSKTGKITAKKTGTAVITVTANGLVSETVTVTVKRAPSSVKIDNKTLNIEVGEKALLGAVLSSNSASNKLTWKSSKTSVATVKDGVVTAVAAGKATITVSTFNGKKATCAVTVTEPDISDVKAGMLYNGGQVHAYAREYMYMAAANENVTLTISKTNVEGSAETQVAWAKKMIEEEGVTFLLVEAVDSTAAYEVEKLAKAAGVKIVFFNSDPGTEVSRDSNSVYVTMAEGKELDANELGKATAAIAINRMLGSKWFTGKGNTNLEPIFTCADDGWTAYAG